MAVATGFGVFVLPLYFPPTHPALSASYSAGFNNRVAAVAAGIAAMITFVIAWRASGGPGVAFSEERGRIRRGFLAGALGMCAVFTLGMGWMLTRAVVAYNDNLYFLEYMDEVATYHLHIYKDFSFLYGPVLLYFPLAVMKLMHPFHVGLQGSYYVALTLMQMLGIVLLYYTLEALPLSRRLKTIALCLFSLCAVCPLMGLNYSLVRSLLPFSTLLFATRLKRPMITAAALFLGELLQLAVSPELGAAFAAGACFYALCRTVTASRMYLIALAAPPLAIAAFLGITGSIYLASVSQFSQGCLNLIVEPLPYMLFFLYALVWLVPRMLGRMVKDGSPDAIPMVSLFVVSMTLVPAAFGRCDPLHVLFNGVGVYLLALVAVSTYSKRMGDWWLIGLTLVLLWTHTVNLFMFVHPIRYAARFSIRSTPESERQNQWYLNFLAVERAVDRGTVSVPFDVPFIMEEELKRKGIYQPDREVFSIGIWDTPTETARVERMDRSEWTLVPTRATLQVETGASSWDIVGWGLPYPERRQPYLSRKLIFNDLATHWTPSARNLDWILYHNNRFASAGSKG